MATQFEPRVATVKWAKALERAIEEALDVLVEPISGEAFVESATRPGTLYAVSASTCSCPAGARGLVCKHRACYLAQIGELPLPTIVGVPVVQTCPSCAAGKIELHAPRSWESLGWKACDVCGGTGVLPAPRPQPYGLPAIQPVAAVAA